MDKGNVLVLGNSGVGKTTLINAVLGEHRGETSRGMKGTTQELKIYESDDLPFRLIDSVGFEPSFVKQQQAIHAVKKWSSESETDKKKEINEVWFCIDGTAGKLFPVTIKNLSSAIKRWPSVPVIVVITKSFSEPDRKENIEMVTEAFDKLKMSKRINSIIPVVASIFRLNEQAYAAPDGITDLIDTTNRLMPEAIKSAERDIQKFILQRKRVFAHGVVTAATAGGTTIGAVPIPIPDAGILAGVETAEISAIAKIYGISNDDIAKDFKKTIVEMGTAGTIAKQILVAIKAIPGLNIAAAAINAVVAGTIVAAVGEISVYGYEQVYLGNKKLDDIDWIRKFGERYLMNKDIAAKIAQILKTISSKSSPKEIAEAIAKFFK